MSRTVDERVVSMQFDNKQFESNVRTSLGTIEKLKRSLNLSGAAKGLEEINTASKNVDMSGLSSAVDTVKVRFSALEVFAVTALTKISNAAINAGERLISAFTIDPIKTGLAEYELKMGSIQTIMASTGESLDTVNSYLNELNEYSDKTIYSFSDMTSNIGKFTNAGVKLEDAVAAIKGVSNVAALSGADANEASRAMYNFSQALSAGYVKLIDWKSIENANMATVEFKSQLLESAVAAGKLTKDADGLYKTLNGTEVSSTKNFNETLQEQWLTSDVLISTLKDYSDETTEIGKKASAAAQDVKTFSMMMDTLKESAQSGWAATWELIIGDFEEAKELWTNLSKFFDGIISASADARNELLEGWKEGGGRDDLFQSFKNIWQALSSIIKPIKEAFRDIFPKTTSEQLINITEAIKNFTSKLILSEKAQAKLKSTFKGLFAVIDIGVTIIKEVISGAVKLVGNIISLGKGVVGVTGSIGDWLSGLRDSIKESGIFATVIGGIVNILQKLIDKVKAVAGFFKEKIAAPGFEGFLSLMEGIWKVITWIGDKVIAVGSAIGKALTNAFRSGDISTALDIVNGGIIAAILLNIKKFVSGFTSSIGEITKLADKVEGILDSVKDCFVAYQKDLQAKTLIKIATAIAILAAAILVIASIEPARLTASLGAITVLFADLMASMAVFSKIGGLKGSFKAAGMMIAMSVSVLILAAALKTMAGIDTDNILSGVMGVAALTAIVVAVAKALSKNTETVIKGGTSLILFAAAIKVLASACKDLSTLSWSELAKGLVGVGVLLAAVVLFLNNANLNGKAFLTATGIVILSAAIKVLASACKDFGGMKLDEIRKGLVTVGILLAEVAAFTKLTSNANKLISTGIAMVLLAASMKIFASAIEDISGMSLEELCRGLVGMAGALASVTIALNVMPENMVAKGLGLIAVATALLIMSNAIGKMGSMSWEGVAKGLIALGGSLAILAIGLHAMTGSLAGSAALIIAAGALAILAPVLLILGAMSWGAIAKGLAVLAGSFIIMGVAGAVLGPIIPVILGLGVALALVGVGVLAAGVGIMSFAAGLTALAAAISTSGTIIVAGVTAILVAIIGLIPSLIAAIGDGIILICETIAGSTSAICGAVTSILVAILQAVIDITPKLMETVGVLLDALLDFLVKYVPKLVDAGVKIVIGFLNGIAQNMNKVMESAVNLINAFLKSLSAQIPRVVQAGIDFIADLINGIAKAIENGIPKITEACVNLGIAIIKGIIKGIGSVGNALWECIKDVGNSVINWFKDIFGIHSPSTVFAGFGKNMMQGLANGIKSSASQATGAVKNIGSQCLKAISGKLGEWKTAGKNMMSGLATGVKSKFESIKETAVNAVSGATKAVKKFLGIESPSKVFAEFGRYMDEGLVVGLKSYVGKVVSTSEDVGNAAVKTMSNTIFGIADRVNSDIDSQPTIRPVLDLSDIESGVGMINGMFGMQPSVGVLSNVGSINSMMNRNQNATNYDVISAIKDISRKIGIGQSNTYNINGVTYDDGSNVANAVGALVRAARIERRI